MTGELATGFWATVCKTVRPTLSDRCSVCPVLSCLSVTSVYCGKTVRWIKMKLGMQVLDGGPAPLPKGAQPPIFGPYVLWPNDWMIKMPLGREVGHGPSDIVLDRDLAPLPKKGTESPIFGRCLM